MDAQQINARPAGAPAALPYPTVACKLRVITLARNEERDLPLCFSCIPDGIKVTVIDSGSSDSTPDIARAAGAEVVFHEFTGFANQRNFGLTEAGVTESWALFIDADEVYTREFWEWAEKWLADDPQIDFVYISQYMALDGYILKHAPAYPLWHPRLVRTGSPKFVQGDAGMHSESIGADLRCINLDIPYIHYWQSGSMKGWAEKHLRLAVEDVTSTNTTDGKKTIRARINRMLGDGFIKVAGRFFYHYLLCGGFMDGRAGFRFSVMYSWYEMSKWMLRDGPREYPVVVPPANVIRRSK
ncbi:MAG: glycosyltransferase family 2 protein [Hyphomonadaceae bacterium]|nr:MAG: family 2 glycosyl transferase [Caulobacteraceae bacterium]MBT9446294.1 glycosyltransferase family 2 protein [Hyphomonadaceae bacterium]TPW08869.1 MAG: family 2 glycosyl transferase [Alphaproteobacteria bacterium]